jgi:PAS domain-containing protein
VIGHRNAEVYGTRLQTLFPTNPGLVVFQNAIQRHVDGFVNYQYPGSTQKTAFLTRVRNIGNRQAPGQLAWTLGVGVNQQDVARLARQGAARFLLPNLLISLMGVAAYWWYIRRFHVSFSDLIDMVKRARTIDEIDTGQVAGREQRYSELIESVADLIVRSRSDSTFIPVQNRYIVGTPLRGAEMFFGREDELRWINDHLQEPGNSIVLFAGQRRIGKTSLLHQTAARVRDIIPVFIDTQALIPTLYTDKDFFVQIGNAVCEQVKTLSGNGGKINAGTLRPVTGPSELAALIAQLSATGRRVVLLIDEMENLDLKFRRGELSPSPLLWLAGQIEDQYPFSVVTTGSSELPQDGDGWDKLAAKVILRKVSYLIHDEAERLVRTPVRGYVSFNQGTVEGMLRFTGCHPYYTQDFCHRLITHINQTHHYDIDSDDIDNISEDMVRNAPNAIDHAWSQFVAPKQAAAAAVAGALETVTEFASPAEALKLVPPDVRKECFSRDVDFQLTLNELLAEEYLERGEDGYRFRCDLWRRWVNEYHPLEV